MKSSLATSLSIVGVIAAGGAAMGLNTAVLTSKSGGSDPVQQVLEQTATTVDGGAPDVVAAAAQTGDQAIASETTTFTIGSAGTVTVTVLGSSLEVTDITAESGWTASPPRYVDSSRVKVHFTSAAQRLEVKIALVGGVPQVTVEDDSGVAAPGYPADDHDDDDGEHEDHDEEHEHEDEHGEEGDDD